MKSVDALPLP